MKISTCIKDITLTAVLTATLSVSVLAQTGPRSGQGSGQMGPGAGSMRFDNTNTPGWSQMTAEERAANQASMLSAKTYEECKTLQSKQHQTMQERATEKGVTLMVPRQNACDRMKARGLVK